MTAGADRFASSVATYSMRKVMGDAIAAEEYWVVSHREWQQIDSAWPTQHSFDGRVSARMSACQLRDRQSRD